MRQEAYFCTVKELDKLGKNNIPRQLISHTHLIYSSPATLAFNSPGAGVLEWMIFPFPT
jgi:nitrogenase molybdenum-cofactor synthesis protein NifE